MSFLAGLACFHAVVKVDDGVVGEQVAAGNAAAGDVHVAHRLAAAERHHGTTGAVDELPAYVVIEHGHHACTVTQPHEGRCCGVVAGSYGACHVCHVCQFGQRQRRDVLVVDT